MIRGNKGGTSTEVSWSYRLQPQNWMKMSSNTWPVVFRDHWCTWSRVLGVAVSCDLLARLSSGEMWSGWKSPEFCVDIRVEEKRRAFTECVRAGRCPHGSRGRSGSEGPRWPYFIAAAIRKDAAAAAIRGQFAGKFATANYRGLWWRREGIEDKLFAHWLPTDRLLTVSHYRLYSQRVPTETIPSLFRLELHLNFIKHIFDTFDNVFSLLFELPNSRFL